jgi:hypothetical protein
VKRCVKQEMKRRGKNVHMKHLSEMKQVQLTPQYTRGQTVTVVIPWMVMELWMCMQDVSHPAPRDGRLVADTKGLIR